ncbi:uncharacterized protein LOC144784276 [Lissotriton helveticus]
MDEQWLVSVCLVLFIIFIFILTRKPKPEAEAPDTAAFDPVLAYASFGGKHLECSEDDMDRCAQRLNKILFVAPSETRRVAATSGSKEQTSGTREAAAVDPVHTHPPKAQERSTEPAAVENIMDEIEQAVQETVESELYMRSRHQARPRRRREGQWSEVIVTPEADNL